MDARGTRNPMAMRVRARLVGTLAVGLSLILALAGHAARADEAEAKSLLKAMSDYLAGEKAVSFDYDTSLEVVTVEQQKLAFASSGTMTLNRPDKIRARRTGGFADVELVFDGKTVSLVGKNANVYGQIEIVGTIDEMVDQMRDKYNRPLPGADLLLSNVYDQLMPTVTDVKDLGSGIVRGVECNHLAFRTADVDWQIWIAAGDRPYPCRYVITSKTVVGFPQYSLDIRNWRTGTAVASDDFILKPPAGAKKADMDKLGDIDELPAAFAMKGK